MLGWKMRDKLVRNVYTNFLKMSKKQIINRDKKTIVDKLPEV